MGFGVILITYPREIIEIDYRLLEQAGITGVTVRLNSIGDPTDRAEYRDELVAYLEDRFELLSEDAKRRIDTNPLRVLDSKADVEVVANAPAPLDSLGDDAAAHFAGVEAGLGRLGIPYEIAPRLVRGLDYYNRTVFEYVSASYGAAQDALGGGGRYDPLAEMLGGPPVAAVGLSMGVDRIILAMPETTTRGVDVFVVVADPERRGEALAMVSSLRVAGIRADMDLGSRSLKAQFKVAGRRSASMVAVVGDEWEGGEVTMRRMSDGEESRVPIEEVATWVTSR